MAAVATAIIQGGALNPFEPDDATICCTAIRRAKRESGIVDPEMAPDALRHTVLTGVGARLTDWYTKRRVSGPMKKTKRERRR